MAGGGGGVGLEPPPQPPDRTISTAKATVVSWHVAREFIARLPAGLRRAALWTCRASRRASCEKESLCRPYGDDLATPLGRSGQKNDTLVVPRDGSNEPDGVTWSKGKMLGTEIGCGAKMHVHGAARRFDCYVGAEWRNGGIFCERQNCSLKESVSHRVIGTGTRRYCWPRLLRARTDR